MQPLSRGTRRQLARWIVTAILAVLVAVASHYGPRRGAYQGNEPTPDSVTGSARTIDGDSLYVDGAEVRLQGIDAPEGRQTCRRDGAEWACGDAARHALRALIGSERVACRVTERDMHGRLLGHCTAGTYDLNARMVADGMAVAFGGYEREEGDAKRAKRGLWASEFERPRDWRHERGIGLGPN